MQSSIGLLLLAACVFAENSSHRSQYLLPKEPSDCSSPYIFLGDRCLLIDSVTKGTYADLQALCQVFNGDLIKIDSMEIMSAIVEYISDSEVPDSSFWVGASDEANEGSWTWTDGTPVTMGMPLWDQCTSRQPDGDENQNCAVMSAESCFFLNDVPCSAQHYGICQAA